MATNAYDTASDQLRGVIPYLSVDGALRAADYYRAAFAAHTVSQPDPDAQGRTMHIHLTINGGPVMLSDFYPDYGHPVVAPQGFMLHLQVDDCDAWYDRALAAGGSAILAPENAFWGDRYAQLRDPFGVMWTIGSAKTPD